MFLKVHVSLKPLTTDAPLTGGYCLQIVTGVNKCSSGAFMTPCEIDTFVLLAKSFILYTTQNFSFFLKVHNFCDFLFAFMRHQDLSEKSLLKRFIQNQNRFLLTIGTRKFWTKLLPL